MSRRNFGAKAEAKKAALSISLPTAKHFLNRSPRNSTTGRLVDSYARKVFAHTMNSFVKRICGLTTFVFFGVLLNASSEMAYYPATGHWYEAVNVPEGITWDTAYTNAINRGGYLCTVTNDGENTFVASLVDSSYYSGVSVNNDILGPWLGGFRHANSGTWQWVTGEPFNYFNWYPGQPDGFGGSEQRLQYYARATVGSTWGDHPGSPISGYSLPRGFIVEYNYSKLDISSSNHVSTVSWSQVTNTWVLEKCTNLSAAPVTWTPLSTNQSASLTRNFYAETNQQGAAFFRLRSN